MCERVRKEYKRPTMVIEQTIPFPDFACVPCAPSYSFSVSHKRHTPRCSHARTHTRHLRTLFT